MTLPLFPLPIGLGPGGSTYVKWSPVFFNQSQKTVSGASIDVALASTPLHNFEFVYGFLRDQGLLGAPTFTGSEFKAVMGFFLSTGGSLGRFRFTNPDDNTVLAQPIGTGDGVTDVFTIVRTYGDPSVAVYTEPVGWTHTTGTLNVYYNGGLRANGTDYVIDNSFPGSSRLSCMTTPNLASPITIDMTYDYYCKFTDDTMTHEKFISQLWTIGSVKIQSCRVGA
jgi:uncharacterized protein (TIGR02217 family)